MEYGLSVVEGSSVTYPACVGRILCVDMVFESCLKMLMTWIDCHRRIECVTYISCMRGCIPAYVSVSHVCVCVPEEWRNSLMSASGEIHLTCIVYYCFSLGCF